MKLPVPMFHLIPHFNRDYINVEIIIKQDRRTYPERSKFTPGMSIKTEHFRQGLNRIVTYENV